VVLLFVAMALSMFGMFELKLPQSLQQRLSRVGGAGLGGAFLMGLAGGIIAAPCTGPPLAGILAYVATTRDAVLGFGLMATYATGIGVPFWAIAGFSLSLPRSGRWMNDVKSVLGIALLVAALYYLKNVAPPLARLTSTSNSFLVACAALVFGGVALGAVHLSFTGSNAGRRVRKAGGIALMSVGLFALTNFFLTPKVELTWHKSETEALAAARATGKPLLVDFGAEWCLPCKELEVNVFGQPQVARVMSERFTLLKIDCTREDEDPAIEALRERYQAAGLPAVRVVTPGDGAIVARLDDANVTPDEFLKILAGTLPGGSDL